MSGTPQKPNAPKAPNPSGAKRPTPPGAPAPKAPASGKPEAPKKPTGRGADPKNPAGKGAAPNTSAPRSAPANGAKKPQNRAPGSAPQKPKQEALSIDALLNDIELEEQKTVEAMPPVKAEDIKMSEPEKAPETAAVPVAPAIVFDELEDDLDDMDIHSPEPAVKRGNAPLDSDLDDDLDDIPAEPEKAEPKPEVSTERKPPVTEKPAGPEQVSEKAPAKKNDSSASFWDDDDDSTAKAAGAAGTAGLLTQLRGRLNGDSEESKKNRRSTIIIILLVIIILILLLQQCGNCGGPGRQDGDNWFDQSAIEGTLPGKTPEEIQAMLNQIVEEGMFNISIAPVIVFENATAEGQARIENVPANHYYMSVKITLDATAETVYESKGIKPGQYIEYITLQKELAPGEHAATALFKAYNADTLEEEGQVAVKITLYVEN